MDTEHKCFFEQPKRPNTNADDVMNFLVTFLNLDETYNTTKNDPKVETKITKEMPFTYNDKLLILAWTCEQNQTYDFYHRIILKFENENVLDASIELEKRNIFTKGSNKFQIVGTSINRVGKKDESTRDLLGIGLSFYETMLDIIEKMAHITNSKLLHVVVPTPNDDFGGQAWIISENSWASKFGPILDKKGYTKKFAYMNDVIMTYAEDANDETRALNTPIPIYEKEYIPHS